MLCEVCIDGFYRFLVKMYITFKGFSMSYTSEIEEQIKGLKDGEQVNAVITKTKKNKTPPYITVGNGLSTKVFQAVDVVDAFAVFGKLSKAQQQLFIMLKDILVLQNMEAHYRKNRHQNPNQIVLQKCKANDKHQLIKTNMSQNKNGKRLMEEGVLKQKKPGVYMLNPYLFIPPYNFKETAEIWKTYK